MAKKVSKWFHIGIKGDTCDDRVISGDDIQDMADIFYPCVYGCRINLEHLLGILPDSVLKRYGDVTEVKAEIINDDPILNGKKGLFGKIAPLDELVGIVRTCQKVYTSMEICPNFANSGKFYLVGLAVTNDPASLGMEYLEFCSHSVQNPIAGKKDQPDDLFSVTSLAELEFEGVFETMLNSLTDKDKSIFSRKVQLIAQIHQLGLQDRPNPHAQDVQYQERQSLGFSLEDKWQVEGIVINCLITMFEE